MLVRIAREAAWAPLAVVILHHVLGGWLGHEPVVDPVMHFSVGAAAAFFFSRSAACARRYLGDPSPLAVGLMAFGLATVAAVGWELAEYLGDLVRGTNVQRGLSNTMRDLFLGVGGAAVYIVAANLLPRVGARA